MMLFRRGIANAAHNVARSKWNLSGIPRPKPLSILEDDSTPVDLSEDNDAVNGVRPGTVPLHLRAPPKKPTPVQHAAHRAALRQSFPDGWAPPRKLSREAMDALRHFHRADPETFTTPVLADKFKISPEAVRRILKSKWEPSLEKRTEMVLKERKARDERREKIRADQRKKQEDVVELRRILRDDHEYRERTGSEEYEKEGAVGLTDEFQLR